MAFNLICPYNALDVFEGSRPQMNESSCYMYWRQGEKATLRTPPLNTLEFMTKYCKATYNSQAGKSLFQFCSENHKIEIKANGTNHIYDVYNDEEKILSDIKINKGRIHIAINNNQLRIRINSELVAEYTGLLLAGEAITSIDIQEVAASPYYNGSFDWFIVSSEKIPQTADVKMITPEAETDWEQDGKQYQTGEANKTMKLKMPENYSPPKGKALFAAAPFLKNVTGGGYVNGINIHTDNMDIDKIITEDKKSFGYYDDGEVVFTTKE